MASLRTLSAPRSAFNGSVIRPATPSRVVAARRVVKTQAIFTRKKAVAADLYVCRLCGYTHSTADGEVPNNCPECGVPKFMFRKDEPEEKPAAKTKRNGKAVEEDAPKKKLFGLF